MRYVEGFFFFFKGECFGQHPLFCSKENKPCARTHVSSPGASSSKVLLTSTLRPAPESQLQSCDWFGSGTGSRSADSQSWTPDRRDRGKLFVGRSLQVWGRWRVGRPPAGPSPRASTRAGESVERSRSHAEPPRESAWTRTETADTCSKLRPYEKPTARTTLQLWNHTIHADATPVEEAWNMKSM